MGSGLRWAGSGADGVGFPSGSVHCVRCFGASNRTWTSNDMPFTLRSEFPSYLRTGERWSGGITRSSCMCRFRITEVTKLAIHTI